MTATLGGQVVYGEIGATYKYLSYERQVRIVSRAPDRGSEPRWVIETIGEWSGRGAKPGRRTTVMDVTLRREYERVSDEEPSDTGYLLAVPL